MKKTNKSNLQESARLPSGVFRDTVTIRRNAFNKNEDQAVLDALKKAGKVPRNSKQSGASLVGMKVTDKNAVDVTVVALYTTNRSAAINVRGKKWTAAHFESYQENPMKTFKQLQNELKEVKKN